MVFGFLHQYDCFFLSEDHSFEQPYLGDLKPLWSKKITADSEGAFGRVYVEATRYRPEIRRLKDQ